MKGGKAKANISLGVFIPSTFYDRDYLFDLLDSRVELISEVVTINTGSRAVEDWADARGKSKVVLNLASHSLMESASIMANLADNICIIDNGHSEAVEKLKGFFDEKEKKYKVVKVESSLPKASLLKKILALRELENPPLTKAEFKQIESLISE